MSETNELPTVTLHHPDGRYVIVNADENDLAYQCFTHQGFQVSEADLALVRPSSFGSKYEELLWRNRQLEAEILRLKTLHE